MMTAKSGELSHPPDPETAPPAGAGPRAGAALPEESGRETAARRLLLARRRVGERLRMMDLGTQSLDHVPVVTCALSLG
jgi:hypothetical protein